MNGAGEFDYARNRVYEALNEVGSRHDLPPVVHSITAYVRKNLDQFLKDAVEMSNAFCACLSLSSDHPKQWQTYSDKGKGFAVGVNLLKVLINQRAAVESRKPFIFCAPVIYNKTKQSELVWHLVEAGIRDLQTFSEKRSQRVEDLTALRNRVTKEIVVHLVTLIDFMKAPTFSSEREFRLMLDPNNGTLKAPNIQHYERDNEEISFLFMDLRNPDTGRLPLTEIKVGPYASFPEEKIFVEHLLDELGYGWNYKDRPQITQSLVARATSEIPT